MKNVSGIRVKTSRVLLRGFGEGAFLSFNKLCSSASVRGATNFPKCDDMFSNYESYKKLLEDSGRFIAVVDGKHFITVGAIECVPFREDDGYAVFVTAGSSEECIEYTSEGLSAATGWLLEQSNVNRLVAEVNSDDKVSLKIFSDAGWGILPMCDGVDCSHTTFCVFTGEYEGVEYEST